MRGLAVLFALSLAACATDPYRGLTSAQVRELDVDAGPRPTLDSVRSVMESAIKARLKDPDSARFDWPNEFRHTSVALTPNVPNGWFTCGSVNARNGFGGYVGKTAVVIVIANGSVAFSDMDSGPYRPIADSCAKQGMPVL